MLDVLALRRIIPLSYLISIITSFFLPLYFGSDSPILLFSESPSLRVSESPSLRVSGCPSLRVSESPSLRDSGFPSLRVSESLNPSLWVSGFPSLQVRVSGFPSLRVFESHFKAWFLILKISPQLDKTDEDWSFIKYLIFWRLKIIISFVDAKRKDNRFCFYVPQFLFKIPAHTQKHKLNWGQFPLTSSFPK